MRQAINNNINSQVPFVGILLQLTSIPLAGKIGSPFPRSITQRGFFFLLTTPGVSVFSDATQDRRTNILTLPALASAEFWSTRWKEGNRTRRSAGPQPPPYTNWVADAGPERVTRDVHYHRTSTAVRLLPGRDGENSGIVALSEQMLDSCPFFHPPLQQDCCKKCAVQFLALRSQGKRGGSRSRCCWPSPRGSFNWAAEVSNGNGASLPPLNIFKARESPVTVGNLRTAPQLRIADGGPGTA